MTLHLSPPVPVTPLSPDYALAETSETSLCPHRTQRGKASSLAVTYIDTERGPTWKDRAMAWVHRPGAVCSVPHPVCGGSVRCAKRKAPKVGRCAALFGARPKAWRVYFL